MSDLGNRLRRELDEVAPPVDLDQVMLHEPVLPFWRVGRALGYAVVLVAAVGVTVVLLPRDGSDEAATESSVTTIESSDSTVGEGTTSTTSLAETVSPVTFDTAPLSGEWFGIKPDTEGLIVLTNDMIWDGDAFYVLTRLGFGDHVVWRSADGVEWERFKTIAEAGELGITGVYSGPTELVSVNGQLIAAGNAIGRATVWIDDGSSPWRSIDVGPGAVRNLLYSDGRFVALVDSVGPAQDAPVIRRPSIWMSPDGENWSQVAGEELFGATNFTSELVSGPAGLLTIGFESDPNDPRAHVAWVFLSRDGSTWSRIEANGLDLTQVDSLVGGDFGYATFGLDSNLLVSLDGVGWSPISHRVITDIEDGYAWGQGLGVIHGKLVMVGGVNFVPEGSEFNTTHPRVWSYVGDGGWARVGEFEWFELPGLTYQVVAGDGVMVILAETQSDGPEEWALLTFVANQGD